MEQRRLRLGDILDDYCPRERRVTNHAVVAMIEEDVKQTRCTTCDSEHAYKGGKEPRRRKKDAGAVLYKEVLAGMPEVPDAPIPEPEPEPIVVAPLAATDNGIEPVAEPADDEPVVPDAEREETGDDGPFHRRLIRATLPRPEGQKEIRQIPEFTIRQNRGNGHHPFRGGKMHAQGGNGNRPQGGRRFGAGGGRGPSAGPGHRPAGPGGPGGRPGMRPNRNRKRSR
jgi:hypothetical protein